MIDRIAAAIFASSLFAGAAIAQTAAPPALQQETSCTTTTGAASAGSGEQKTVDSLAMDKSAILPSASGHANSAAPTVQSDGKPMKVRKDCPPDVKTN